MSVTALHVLYKREFEPIVRPLENVGLFDGGRWVYGRVVFVEPLQERIINLGELGPADPKNYPTPGGERRLRELAVGDHEFAQYRIQVLDDFLLEVREPAAIARFTVKEYVTKMSRGSSGGFTEIFVYEDNVPTVKPYSILFTSLPMARIRVVGFRYVLEPTPKPKEFTVIPVGGVAPRVRR